MKRCLTLLLGAVLCACSAIPTPMQDGNGKARMAWMLGGKGSLSYAADGSMSYIYSNEKSLQQTWQALVSLGMSGFQAWSTIKQELTKQLANQQLGLTERARITADLKATEAKLNAASATNGKAMDTGLFQPEATPYVQQ